MSTPLLNIGGLASGLDTNSIVDQLMAIERQPRTRLDQQASLSTARQSALADFQTRLRAVEAAAKVDENGRAAEAIESAERVGASQ